MKHNKYTPPTPEEQEAAKQRTLQQAKARCIEKEKQFATQVEERLSLLRFARVLADDPQDVGTSLSAYVLRSIAKKFLDCDAELEEWTKNFMFCPASEMEWISKRMEQAATWNTLAGMLYHLRKGRSVAEVVNETKNSITEKLLNNFDAPTSTSPGHNAMMIAQTSARSMLLRYDLSLWSRGLDKEVQAQAQQPAAASQEIV